jgi:hypothetical protein
MRRYEWRYWTSKEAVWRRACGRRRWNARRRQQAEQRRAQMAVVLERMEAEFLFFHRGLPAVFARRFGVHPTTSWRDLQRILWPPKFCYVDGDGKLLYSVTRACQGGPIVSVTDPDGYEIRGARRRQIIRQLPRYVGRRGG